MNNTEIIQPVEEIQLAEEIQPAEEIQQVLDATQPVNEMDEWVLELGAVLDLPVFTHPPDPFLVVIEMPSIFGNWQRWDDFEVSFLSETKKLQFVAYMRQWFALDLHSYSNYMRANVDLAWSYYRGVSKQFRDANSKRFIEHLLGISCFLIFAMIIFKDEGGRLWSILSGDPNQTDRYIQFYNLLNLINNSESKLIQHYMLTMNYQIPLFVIEAIYTNHSNLSNLFNRSIYELALSSFDELYPGVHESKKDVDLDGIVPRSGFKHLLHIFHWSRSPQEKFLLTRPLPGPLKKMDSFHIPCATELQLSHTFFKKHHQGSIDVDFSERRLSGVMKLAHWHLLPYTVKLYESLLRFEWDYHDCGFPFTAYVACMVCLLQTEADVKLLRANGIVPNTMNDENDVLRYVQELKHLLHDDIRVTDDLHNLSAKVMACYENKFFRRLGEFKNRYCENIWITISFIVGFLLFLLTIMQTVLSFVRTI